ncbi:MAG TPA: ribonuclease HI family protein [Acidobacteriaceae bacterium]|jgi:probable phosphoglycerate mutase|nr:ribonuclease HI family protein [Acidobacteriaceae bacterium]
MLRDSGSLFGEASGGLGSSSTAAVEWVTAFCDGGSRGNPGPAGYGVFIQGEKGEKLAELSEFVGRTTNNVAEYRALLGALEWALEHGRGRLRVVGDSELLVKQIQGRYKVASPDLRPLYEEAKRRIARLDGFRIEHVLRGKNKDADRLANLAMDRGMGRSSSAGASGAGRPTAAAPGSSRGPEPPKTVKGFVKGGVVHLIEGELPDGAFVKVTVDRQ